MGVANRIDPQKLFPRSACGRPICKIFALRKYSAIRYNIFVFVCVCVCVYVCMCVCVCVCMHNVIVFVTLTELLSKYSSISE